MFPLRLIESEWEFLVAASREMDISVAEIFRSEARLYVEKKGKGESRTRKEQKR